MPSSGATRAGADEPNDHLSRFVRDWLQQHGETERGLAKRTVDPETKQTLQHGWINTLASNRVPRAPELWRLRALAVGMRVPAKRLAQLSGKQWLELEVAEIAVTSRDTVVVTVPADLTDEERAKFIRMAEGMARSMRE